MNLPINLLYIMGTGRSATTILEIILTNNPKITGVGEVTHIFRDRMNRLNLRAKVLADSPAPI